MSNPSAERLLGEAADNIYRLRLALKPFVEADWYAAGNGRFEARVSKEALDEAKAIFAALPR